MHSAFEFFAALGVGLLTADMFVRSWTGVLAFAACLVLFFRKKITLKKLILRLNSVVPQAIICGLTVVFCFKIYFSILGLGHSELEQLGYFIGAVPRTGFFLINAGRIIDNLLKP